MLIEAAMVPHWEKALINNRRGHAAMNSRRRERNEVTDDI